MSITDYSSTPGNNTAISGINIAEGCLPGNVNNAIRQMMADLATLNASGFPSSSWKTARTLTLSGAVTGSASIKGDANISLYTTLTSGGGGVTAGAPKPQTASGVGQWLKLSWTTSNNVVLPSGGSWAWFVWDENIGSMGAGVNAGGSVIFTANNTVFGNDAGFAWRVA